MRTVLRCALLLAALGPLGGAAEEGGAPPSELPLLVIRTGDSVAICKTGTIICPATLGTCDDPAVAAADSGDDGIVFRGISPGATVCSAVGTSGVGPRKLYRVKVVP